MIEVCILKKISFISARPCNNPFCGAYARNGHGRERKKQGKSLSLARCESIGEGWRNVADLESTVSVDTENKAEGDASIKLVSSKDQADENGVRGKFYLRTGNIIDLTNYSELTFKFYVDRVIMNDNKLKIDLSSADEGNDGYSYEVNMKLWRKGWHDVTLDLTNLPEPSVATDKTSIKRICFTWLNVKRATTLFLMWTTSV